MLLCERTEPRINCNINVFFKPCFGTKQTVYRSENVKLLCICVPHTLCGEIKQHRPLSSIRELEDGLTELVKESVSAGLERSESGRRRVLQQSGTQGYCLRRGPRPENLTYGQQHRIFSARYKHFETTIFDINLDLNKPQ